MNWKPKSDEEIQRDSLAPEGRHPFTVLEASEEFSKKGAPMIKLKLNLHTNDGDRHVYDYISPEFFHHKFKHFFYCIGKQSIYEGGSAVGQCPDLLRREGYCEVDVQEASGGYDAKNVVRDYIVKEAPTPGKSEPGQSTTKPRPTQGSGGGSEDDVPF